MEAPDDPVSRALGYPYAAHPDQFQFRAGCVQPLDRDFDRAGFTPVVAVGSNRAPAQLARKFGTTETVIPVTRARARDVDVV